jgi:hypothetical protein
MLSSMTVQQKEDQVRLYQTWAETTRYLWWTCIVNNIGRLVENIEPSHINDPHDSIPIYFHALHILDTPTISFLLGLPTWKGDKRRIETGIPGIKTDKGGRDPTSPARYGQKHMLLPYLMRRLFFACEQQITKKKVASATWCVLDLHSCESIIFNDILSP